MDILATVAAILFSVYIMQKNLKEAEAPEPEPEQEPEAVQEPVKNFSGYDPAQLHFLQAAANVREMARTVDALEETERLITSTFACGIESPKTFHCGFTDINGKKHETAFTVDGHNTSSQLIRQLAESQRHELRSLLTEQTARTYHESAGRSNESSNENCPQISLKPSGEGRTYV